MSSVLAVLSTSVVGLMVGLMVGLEFAVAFVLNRILLALPAAASMAGRAHGGRLLGRAMPFWYVGSLVLTGALAASTWGTVTATVAVVAAALLAVSVVMSVVLLVPINDRSTTWTPEAHPADWRDQQRRWDRLHHVRVALIVVAFVLVATATSAL
jgi:hypothetical protein